MRLRSKKTGSKLLTVSRLRKGPSLFSFYPLVIPDFLKIMCVIYRGLQKVSISERPVRDRGTTNILIAEAKGGDLALGSVPS